MCRVFGVSRSRYYAQLIPGGSKRQREDQRLLVSIKASFDGSERTYGAGRICWELREQGILVGKNRVWRLMKQHGLRVKTMRRFKVTTNSDHKRPVASNLVRRNFTATVPDRLWTGRYHLYLDSRGLAVSGSHSGCLLPPHSWMEHEAEDDRRPRDHSAQQRRDTEEPLSRGCFSL